MIYYTFQDEAAAIIAEQQICNNVLAWCAANVPEALSADGTKVRCRNAATGQYEDVYTERWAIPEQINDGRWVFQKPTESSIAPIELAVVLNGVTASEAEADPAWWPQPVTN